MGKKSRERRARFEQRMAIVQEEQDLEILDTTVGITNIMLRDDYFALFAQRSIVFNGDDAYSYAWQNFPSPFYYLLEPETYYKKWVDLGFNLKPPYDEIMIEFNRDVVVMNEGSGEFVDCAGVHIYDAKDQWLEIATYTSRDGEIEKRGNVGIKIDENGKIIDISRVHQGRIAERVCSLVTPALFVLNLLNCRNIKTVDREPNAETSELHQRYYGVPMISYKTIHVKPIGKQSSNGVVQEYQDLMPLHLRRGNFATYRDDAPLFGKFTGTFWRPATVVGSEKNGIVVKDYEVEPPTSDPQHTRQ